MERLGTKAETLAVMYGKLNTAEVLPYFIFTVAEWEQGQEAVTQRFSKMDWSTSVIVRSSCQNEDTQDVSMAKV